MDAEERALQERLAEAGARAPPGDADAIWQRTTRRIGQRRRRRAAMSVTSVALVLLGGGALTLSAWEDLFAPEPSEPQQVVLEPASEPVAAPAAAAGPSMPSTPEDAPPPPPVDVPPQWETVDLGGAFITVPPQWAQAHYELADGDQPDCPQGRPALVVAHDVRPAGCSPADAALPEGLVVAPINVAHEVVGAVAAAGNPVRLPGAPARGRPMRTASLLGGHAGEADRDVLVLPGVADGLLVEVVGADGVVEALVAGEALDATAGRVGPRAATVRRALATLRPDGQVDLDAVAVGQHDDHVMSVDGDGHATTWREIPGPVHSLTLADRASDAAPVAAALTGDGPALAVLVGNGGDVEVVHREPPTGSPPEAASAEVNAVAWEAVWAQDRAHLAWLEPDDAGVTLRVIGWSAWDDLLAGDEPDDDLSAPLAVPAGAEAPLGLVSWTEHGDGKSTLELGARSEPEGFGSDRWGITLEFDERGRAQIPSGATPGRIGTD